MAVSAVRSRNRLLAALAPADLARLKPHLTTMNLKLRHPLEKPNKPIEYVYFMHTGIASVVAVQSNDTSVEIGLIGREGVSGSAILLGNDRSPNFTYMQVAGSGERMPADVFRKAVQRSEPMQTVLLRYLQTFMLQTAHTAVANARATVPQRLARWLLMAQDRVGSDTLELTHEFLALMLGVRRAGVTEAIHTLSERGLVKAPARGRIVVQSREGLIRAAGESYGIPEEEYRRLIG